LGERSEVRVARREFRPGVADTDHRPAFELVLRKAAVPEPRSIVEAHPVLAGEPGFAAQGLAASIPGVVHRHASSRATARVSGERRVVSVFAGPTSQLRIAKLGKAIVLRGPRYARFIAPA